MPGTGLMAVSNLISVREEDSVSRKPWPDLRPRQQRSLNALCKASALAILLIHVKLVLYSTTEAQCDPVLLRVLLHIKRTAQVCDHQLSLQPFQT